MTTRYPRLLPFALILLTPLIFSSCVDRGLSMMNGYLGKDSFPLNQPSARVLAMASSMPKDRHAMPVYPFRERDRIVRTTAYTSTEWDHRRYGRHNATGTHLLYGNHVRSAAADWSFYPVGTTFHIKGLPQLFVVDDYGSALTGTGTIDLYKPTKKLMRQWGERNVEIEIVQWGSFERSAEMLSQRTRYRHCRAMLRNIYRLKPVLRNLEQK